MSVVSLSQTDAESKAMIPQETEVENEAGGDRDKNDKKKTKKEREDEENNYQRERFTRKLRRGLLRMRNQYGAVLEPFMHQYLACKFLHRKDFGVLAHDAGLGKTATVALIYAYLWHVARRDEDEDEENLKLLVSCPTAVLDQWRDTLLDWLNIEDDDILCTNVKADVTKEALANAKFVILSRDTFSGIYKSCHEKVEREVEKECKDGRFRKYKVKVWERIPGKSLHPLLRIKDWALFVADEAHYMRNPDTTWCVAHARVSENCEQRLALTATPICNKPLDMVGICKAIGAVETDGLNRDFRDLKYWVFDPPMGKELRKKNVESFKDTYLHRVDDSVLDLPPIHHEVLRFDPGLGAHAVGEYNAVWCELQEGVARAEREGDNSSQTLVRLVTLLGTLQKYLVSPMLAQCGSDYFKGDDAEEAIDEAVDEILAGKKDQPAVPLYMQGRSDDVRLSSDVPQPVGAVPALESALRELLQQGIRRIIVACEKVVPMEIAIRYLERRGLDLGEVVRYNGTLGTIKRKQAKRRFLNADSTSVMFLSIGSGGVGLHLVGTPAEPSAVVFWGARSFSPASVWQTQKRMHRIGQTHELHVKHVIAYGSVDDAINRVHVDKTNLSKAIVDGDYASLKIEAENEMYEEQAAGHERPTLWKKVGRYADNCLMLCPDGNFPAEPEPEEEEDEEEDEEAMMDSDSDSDSDGPKARAEAAAPSGNAELRDAHLDGLHRKVEKLMKVFQRAIGGAQGMAGESERVHARRLLKDRDRDAPDEVRRLLRRRIEEEIGAVPEWMSKRDKKDRKDKGKGKEKDDGKGVKRGRQEEAKPKPEKKFKGGVGRSGYATGSAAGSAAGPSSSSSGPRSGSGSGSGRSAPPPSAVHRSNAMKQRNLAAKINKMKSRKLHRRPDVNL